MITHCDMTLKLFKFAVIDTYSESQIIFTHSCLCSPAGGGELNQKVIIWDYSSM